MGHNYICVHTDKLFPLGTPSSEILYISEFECISIQKRKKLFERVSFIVKNQTEVMLRFIDIFLLKIMYKNLTDQLMLLSDHLLSY